MLDVLGELSEILSNNCGDIREAGNSSLRSFNFVAFVNEWCHGGAVVSEVEFWVCF